MIHSIKFKLIIITIIFLQIIHLSLKRVQFNHQILLNSFKKDYLYQNNLIPKETIEIDNILKEENKNYFNLSKKIIILNYEYQRTVEYLYPKKIDSSSNVIFYLIDENVEISCKLIKRYKFVKKVKC